MRIALTQSQGRLEGLEQALRERGHEVLRSPLIKTETLLSDNVRQRAYELLACPWLLFTSPAGVEAWQDLELPLQGVTAKIGTVGAKTAKTLKNFGARVSLVAKTANAAGLAQSFLENPQAKGPVGLLRGDRALPTLQDELEKNSIETRPLVIYRTVMLDWPVEDIDIILLSSPSAVEALPPEVGMNSKLVTLGPSTAAAAAEYGWRSVQAEAPDAPAVLRAIERLVKT